MTERWWQLSGELEVARSYHERAEVITVAGVYPASTARFAMQLLRSDALREGSYLIGDWRANPQVEEVVCPEPPRD